MTPEHAILAAGNFWNLQDIFEKQTGILMSQVGYTGGWTPNPDYIQLAQENTGHSEAVEIIYNPTLINYSQILDVFFNSHNPTEQSETPRFASTIFFLNHQQKQIAIEKLNEHQKRFSSPILTQIRPASIFYPAEPHHQHYLIKAGQTSCCLTTEC